MFNALVYDDRYQKEVLFVKLHKNCIFILETHTLPYNDIFNHFRFVL